MPGDRTRYICTNHIPASAIFESVRDPEGLKCPICRLSEFVYSYRGDKGPNVKQLRRGGDDKEQV